MNETVTPKPKKSVALSGVTAGNTALCSVGRTGNDLHYRGYDILDVAEACEFEEIAHLLVHGTLPNASELAAYKTKLRALRGIPAAVKTVLESIPAAAHPMDVMRTYVSALGCVLPEPHQHGQADARDIADRLMASLGSALLYWYHYATNGNIIELETDDDSIGGHFLHLLHGKPPSASWVRAMHTSLVLYAEHEFNASTFAARVVAGTGSDIYLRGRDADPQGFVRDHRLCRLRSAGRDHRQDRRAGSDATSARRVNLKGSGYFFEKK
jgi:2-methylcitrate synthase